MQMYKEWQSSRYISSWFSRLLGSAAEQFLFKGSSLAHAFVREIAEKIFVWNFMERDMKIDVSEMTRSVIYDIVI